MRAEAEKAKIERFLRELGSRVSSAGNIYLTGGGTAVLLGWRGTTIDLDIKAEPEPGGFFQAIAELKEEIDINVELAAPDDFLPALPGWQDRSLFIVRHGPLNFYHYDPSSQALAKIERGHARDLDDVAAMLERGLVDRTKLWQLFEAIEPDLIRFPSINPKILRTTVSDICHPEAPENSP